jgi:hypothetical protein
MERAKLPRWSGPTRVAQTKFATSGGSPEVGESPLFGYCGEPIGHRQMLATLVIQNLTEFFDRFRKLNVRSNAQLNELVTQTQQIVQGVQPQQLRDSDSLRQRVSRQMSTVQASLDGLLVDRPRRNILRRPK